MLFNVSDHVGMDDAYVVFEVGQFDSYSYLFNQPFFISLDASAVPNDIPLKGMRLGINGRELPIYQVYMHLDVILNENDYAIEGQQRLSPFGAVILLEKGPANDEFFLTFEQLGASENVFIEAEPPVPALPPSVPRGMTLGLRDFAEINATMSKMTTVPMTRTAATYQNVRQALPVNTAASGFLPSQQTSVTQLALNYCNELVRDPTLRVDYFPNLSFSASHTTAFTDRSVIIDPLIDHMVGSGMTVQPADIAGGLNSLIDKLIDCGGDCEPDRTERVAVGACAAVLASGAMIVQ